MSYRYWHCKLREIEMEKVKNLGWTIIVGQVRTLQCTYNLSAYGLFKLWPTKYFLILRQFRVRKISRGGISGRLFSPNQSHCPPRLRYTGKRRPANTITTKDMHAQN